MPSILNIYRNMKKLLILIFSVAFSLSVFGQGPGYQKIPKLATNTVKGIDASGNYDGSISLDTAANSTVVAPGSVFVGTSTVNTKAAFQVVSTTKYVMLTNMTSTQMQAITSPEANATVRCTDCGGGNGQTMVFDGNNWVGQ